MIYPNLLLTFNRAYFQCTTRVQIIFFILKTYPKRKAQMVLSSLKMFFDYNLCIAHTQYAEARCYPQKRCLGFDFKFKKFSLKQAIFVKDIFPSHVKAHTQKPLKNSEKKLQFFFCLSTFTWEGKMSVLKIACFMLNFLNLKSKPRHLFFG